MSTPVRQVWPQNGPPERRLVAIMAADVVGYSRLMGADEDGTAARLQQVQRAIIAPAVAAEQGRIFKLMGDAVLAEFPSAVGAVRCAAAVQAQLATQEAERPADQRLRLRIGVHSGDVLTQGEDLIGDGVNVAARLEGIAEPGGVAVSAAVAEAVRGKGPFALIDMGEKALKNIDRPVRVFRLAQPGSTAAAAHARPWPAIAAATAGVLLLAGAGAWWLRLARAPDRPPVAAAPIETVPRLSFVVLPFANRSGDAEQDYFVDGLTESLTTDLSRLEGSFVISRGSAFTYKGRSVDLRQVGRELGVRYVVEGSVLRAGDRMRVTAELVEAETGRQLWADSFDGDRRDMLDMVDSATARLGRALGVQAIEQESRRAQRTQNPAAADFVLRGWAAINRGVTRENYTEAEGFFRKAQALEPGNPGAALGLARVLTAWLSNNWIGDRAAVPPLVEAQLATVFQADPDNALALTVFCVLQQQTGHAAGSIAACRQALALNPNQASAYLALAGTYNFNGQPVEALGQIERVFRLSPRDPLLAQFHQMKGQIELTMARYGDAIDDLEQSMRLNPSHQQVKMILAGLYAMAGRMDEARSLLAEFLRTAPQSTVAGIRGYLLTQSTSDVFMQSREYLFEGLRRAGMPEG